MTAGWYQTGEYQRCDTVATTPGVQRHGIIGPYPEADQWTWVIQAVDVATGTEWLDDCGNVADEAAAKRAVATWAPH